ncbi:HAD family hydrolase [Glutamicibacter sp. MNS18]|uniref:HAD family hydrolase n=1 Tax=Glutamicibacter sp. MNS18 TaxID=2989817 RepID=UPI0022368A1E|nr:HAD family hydrolase [Glutamicibacter sp. MNS18]MCW4466180.1 HAD family hydrolase [Glutamicibacter sp. MNS18]
MKRQDAALDTTASAAGIEGVLYDIDDTLVDLRTASLNGFLAMSAHQMDGVPEAERHRIAADFADDGAGAYERYMSGELTFLQQRALRVERAYRMAGITVPDANEMVSWVERYEQRVQQAWRPFADVLPHLDRLQTLGIPIGAVSNNVEHYQRNKLSLAGLSMIQVVIGSDTAGAPKPDPAPFLAGCAALGTRPGRTLYVGDNPINDAQGAHAAGLLAVLVDRGVRHRNSAFPRVENLGEIDREIRENPGFFGLVHP